MASPVAHAAISWALLKGAPGDAVPWRGAGAFAAAAVLGNLPDADFLPGLATGAWNRWHQGISHSAAGILLLALAAAGIARLLGGRIGRPGTAAAWCLALAAGHLLIDMVTRDPSPPVGIPLLWPLSQDHLQLPVTIFPSFAKTTPRELLTTPANLATLGLESLAALPVALASWLAVRLAWRCRR